MFLTIQGVHVHLSVAPGLPHPVVTVCPSAWRPGSGQAVARRVAAAIAARLRWRPQVQIASSSWRTLCLKVEANFGAAPGPPELAAVVGGVVAGLEPPRPGQATQLVAGTPGRRGFASRRRLDAMRDARYIWAASPLGTGEVLNRTRPTYPLVGAQPAPHAAAAPALETTAAPISAPAGVAAAPAPALARPAVVIISPRTPISQSSSVHRFTHQSGRPVAGEQPPPRRAR